MEDSIYSFTMNCDKAQLNNHEINQFILCGDSQFMYLPVCSDAESQHLSNFSWTNGLDSFIHYCSFSTSILTH